MGKLKLDPETLAVQSFQTQQAGRLAGGTVEGRMVTAPTDDTDCCPTNADCHGGGGGGGGADTWTNGDSCDPYVCGGDYTVVSCRLSCGAC